MTTRCKSRIFIVLLYNQMNNHERVLLGRRPALCVCIRCHRLRVRGIAGFDGLDENLTPRFRGIQPQQSLVQEIRVAQTGDLYGFADGRMIWSIVARPRLLLLKKFACLTIRLRMAWHACSFYRLGQVESWTNTTINQSLTMRGIQHSRKAIGRN
jgi:hypothetical protein